MVKNLYLQLKKNFKIFSKLYKMGYNIFVNTIFVPEASGDNSQLSETQFFVQVQRNLVAGNHCIELQYFIIADSGLFQTVFYQHFAHMFAPELRRNGVTCIADMTASAYIVRVQYIQSGDFTGLAAAGYAGKSL